MYLWDPTVILVSLFQVLILQIARLIPFRKIRQMKLQLRELVKSIIGCWPCSPTQERLSTTPKVCLILSSGHYLLITLNYWWQTPKWSSWTLIQLLPFPQFMSFFGMLFSLTFPPLTLQSVSPRAPCCRSIIISVRCHITPDLSVLNPKAHCQELWKQNIFADWWVLWAVLLQVFVERWHPSERSHSGQAC